MKQTDANAITRKHLYYSNKVNRIAASYANRCVGLLKRPTLILIEEVEQFTYLLPYLMHGVKFAHGGALTSKAKNKLHPDFHKSDPTVLVKEFNEGKIPILVGTSCISMGTDLQAAEAIIYLQGGKSEIQVRQAIGRGTRLFTNPWTGEPKVDCLIFDFDVFNEPTLHRHTAARRAIYKSIEND